MSGFSAEEAFEFQGTDDAEMIDWDMVVHICEDHGANPEEFAATEERIGPMVDAGDLLAWLGY